MKMRSSKLYRRVQTLVRRPLLHLEFSELTRHWQTTKCLKLVEDGQSTDGTVAGYEYVHAHHVSIDGKAIGDIDMDTMNSDNLELDVYPGVDNDVSLERTPE
jgi:hypothetical protein